ncbi:glycosyltransferase family 39 protein [Pararhodospirillum oryzae]|uniref:Glycosyl transferase n=1 Tax=Pararhodospirillum oryzae TaxID=478448 RepID=A0A512H451_9PROT|nr:glycosyltransferase family 39 protein [Pararhodospirillum oryzae]GEO80211.1 glycosyl transferase [Pararhodospirillum oryzae]
MRTATPAILPESGPAAWIASPARVALMAAGVLGAVFVVFGFVFTGLPRDELESVFWGQTLAWGYDIQQPPLHNWLAVGAMAVLGPTPLAFALLRVLSLGGMLAGVWLSTRTLAGRDSLAPGLAVAAVLSTTLFGVGAVLNLTHSLVLLAVFAFLPWAVARLDAPTPPPGAALALGVVLGLGTLSKYTFVLFAAAFLLAALTHPRMRRVLLRVRLIVPTAVVAGLLVLPHGLWVLGADHTVVDELPGLLHGRAAGLGARLWDLLRTGWLDPVAGVALPLVLMGLIVPAALPGGRWGAPADPDPPAPWRRVLLVAVGLSMLLVSLVTLAAGGSRLREHYLMPAALLLPMWAALRVAATRPGPARAGRVAGVLIGAAGLVVGGVLVAGGVVRPLSCTRCLTDLPVPQWAEGLRAQGFQGGTVVAPELDAAANLMRAFPGSRLLWPPAGPRQLAWRPGTRGDDCLVVLSSPAEWPRVRAWMENTLGADGLPSDPPLITLHAPLRGPLTERDAPLNALAWPGGVGDCR